MLSVIELNVIDDSFNSKAHYLIGYFARLFLLAYEKSHQRGRLDGFGQNNVGGKDHKHEKLRRH